VDLYMRRYASAAALLLATGVAVVFAVAHFQQAKSTQLNIISTYFLEPPRSLPEMVNAADAVVFGRVLGGESKEGGFFHKNGSGITTFYRFEAEEILATGTGRSIDPNELTIVRDGGSIEQGHHVVKSEVEDFPQFESGQEYVLFLRWNTEHEAWAPAWGPHGTFHVTAGKVQCLGFAAICKEQNGLSIDDFLAGLRRRP
jgi:hypothetical protein